MSKIINLGIIGVGYWGSRLAGKFNSLPYTQVSLAADLKKARLSQIKKQLPKIKTTTNYKEIVANPSVHGIIIATPVKSHYQVTKDCLLAGKHVFVEKPLSQTVNQAKELVNLAKRKKLVLMTDYTYLYHPAVQKMKELMEKGKFGKILFIQSVRLGLELFPKGVDVIWDLAPHDIALIYYLLGKKPRRITVRGNALINKDSADTAFINLLFSKNLVAQVMISWLSPTKVRHFAIGGTKGTLVFNKTKKDKLLFFETKIDRFASHKIFQPAQKGIKIPFPNQEPLLLACQDFVNSIIKEKEPLTGKNISRKTVEILQSVIHKPA